MEVSKLTSKGQITVPVAIRKKLNLKEGDKIVFIEEGDKVYVANATVFAFMGMQRAFSGEAERLGLKDPTDVAGMVHEVRESLRNKKDEGND